MKLKIFFATFSTLFILLTGSTIESCCSTISATEQNIIDTERATESILKNQKTPTDLTCSLERYNLIKRAYWVNGQREKAATVPCDVDRPIGYIILINHGTVIGQFTVDGKVSSLNSYLSADSEYFEYVSGPSTTHNHWLADVDGSYGTNVDGIFWFTEDGIYHEWNGQYLYSDIPLHFDEPVLKTETVSSGN